MRGIPGLGRTPPRGAGPPPRASVPRTAVGGPDLALPPSAKEVGNRVDVLVMGGGETARAAEQFRDDAEALRRGRSARWFSRGASIGLTLVLVGMTGFAMWSSRVTSDLARHSVAASVLAFDYTDAIEAVQTEESLERKYRLEPSEPVRQLHAAAATKLVAAIQRVRRDGNGADRTLGLAVLALHAPYLLSIQQLFAAVDGHDSAAVLRIDGVQVDPRFGRIEHFVLVASESHQTDATRSLRGLQRRESQIESATPPVFGVALTLVFLFSSVLRRARRQLHLQREQVLQDSLHDPLTGLANRALLGERFGQALLRSARDGTRTALLLLDLDRFREVNDTLGRYFGDQLLRQIGPRLKKLLRAEDTVARLGGDEFAILLPDVASLDAATLVAEKLRHSLQTPFVIDGLDLDVEASVGIVVSGLHGDDVTALLQHADTAMYVAKKHDVGVFAYQADADENSVERLTLLSELRHAIDRRELLLHYQPKIRLSSGEMCGVEALVRWRHPRLGLVPPDHFIPLAEQTGLIGPLTVYVLDAALAQARAWLDSGYRIPVAVNLSARNLLDERLPDMIAELLRSHDVPVDLLEVEVTESAIMTEPARARALLARLKTMGLRIAIDDFGVGYTSLAQLKTLPVTELKIDKSFVTSMDTDSRDAHIVKSVIDLGHNLGLATIAEGVENFAVLAALDAAGCDIAQGFHVCRPVPATDLTAWFLAHRVVSTHSA